MKLLLSLMRVHWFSHELNIGLNINFQVIDILAKFILFYAITCIALKYHSLLFFVLKYYCYYCSFVSAVDIYLSLLLTFYHYNHTIVMHVVVRSILIISNILIIIISLIKTDYSTFQKKGLPTLLLNLPCFLRVNMIKEALWKT